MILLLAALWVAASSGRVDLAPILAILLTREVVFALASAIDE